MAAGVPSASLMDHAAAALEAAIVRDFPRALSGRIAILCGPGNNGGDGKVLAKKLEARRVPVFVVEAAGLDAAAWQALRADVLACDLLVDAVFGTGLLRPLRGSVREIILDLNQQFTGPVLAADLPSGLGADGEGPADAGDAVVLRATATVTFAVPKRGLYLSRHAASVGRLTVAPIGIPESVLAAAPAHLRVTGPGDVAPFLAPRPADSHKGRYGHVFVLAGSGGKSGAAVLASTAALRMGAGLVTAAVPEPVQPIVAAALPELMTEILPESPAAAAALLAPATVLAIGPGLGGSPAVSAAVRHLVATVRIPCVLDADGLNAFHGRRAELRLADGVLTPHPGEMARLFEVSTAEVQSRRLYFAQRLAAESGAIVVLKGHFSLISAADCSTFVNPCDSPGMATAGSGDVLTGFIAGLLAQHPAAPRLAVVAAAVYLHGLAGSLAARRLGEMSMISSDITAALPDAIREALRG